MKIYNATRDEAHDKLSHPEQQQQINDE